MMAADATSQRTWLLDDVDSVLAFYRANVAEVHRYVSRLTGGDRARTEDLVQEVFVQLARAVRNGNLQTAHVGWLITTARLVVLHADRHDRREDRRLVLVGGWRVASPRDTARTAEDVVLRQAVARLKAHERAALVLRYVDDLPVTEVASLLDRSVEATESLLVRARRRLRDLMGEEG